jgi:hypothetical protein
MTQRGTLWLPFIFLGLACHSSAPSPGRESSASAVSASSRSKSSSGASVEPPLDPQKAAVLLADLMKAPHPEARLAAYQVDDQTCFAAARTPEAAKDMPEGITVRWGAGPHEVQSEDTSIRGFETLHKFVGSFPPPAGRRYLYTSHIGQGGRAVGWTALCVAQQPTVSGDGFERKEPSDKLLFGLSPVALVRVRTAGDARFVLTLDGDKIMMAFSSSQIAQTPNPLLTLFVPTPTK